MMGVICGRDGGVKGAGHQRDKYKLKLMQVSFLLDQFVLGGSARAEEWLTCHLLFHFISVPAAPPLEAKKMKKRKVQNQMFLP